MSANAARRPAPPTGWAAVRAADLSCSAGALRGRRLIGLLFLSGLPILVQLAFLAWGGGRNTAFAAYALWVSNSYLSVIIPLTLVFLATAAFGDEWDTGTANYLVLAPLPRGLIVIGRFLACVRRALVLVLPSMLVVYLLCVAPHEGALLHYLPDAGWVLLFCTLAILAYTAVFLFLGLWLRRSIMSAFVYWFLFDGLVGSLPSGFATISISFHARNLLWRTTGAPAFEPHLLESIGMAPPSATTSVVTQAVFVVLFLAFCTRVLRRKEFSGSGQQADVAPGA
jgi:ABC-type transport system involved in multi-copper enzyme maturation permease subunit